MVCEFVIFQMLFRFAPTRSLCGKWPYMKKEKKGNDRGMSAACVLPLGAQVGKSTYHRLVRSYSEGVEYVRVSTTGTTGTLVILVVRVGLRPRLVGWQLVCASEAAPSRGCPLACRARSSSQRRLP